MSHSEVECSESGERRSSGYVRTDQAVHCALGAKTNQVGQKAQEKKKSAAVFSAVCISLTSTVSLTHPVQKLCFGWKTWLKYNYNFFFFFLFIYLSDSLMSSRYGSITRWFSQNNNKYNEHFLWIVVVKMLNLKPREILLQLHSLHYMTAYYSSEICGSQQHHKQSKNDRSRTSKQVTYLSSVFMPVRACRSLLWHRQGQWCQMCPLWILHKSITDHQ